MGEDNRDNIIQFPKLKEVQTLYNEGLFGLTLDKIGKVVLYKTSIGLWFKNSDENDVWDMTLEYATEEDANYSYHELLDIIRKLRFKVIKPAD